jgi:hypothetical protein
MDKGLISILAKELRKVIQSLEDPQMSDNVTLRKSVKSVANVVLLILPELADETGAS